MWGLGCGVWVLGSGFWVWGFEFWGLGFGVWGFVVQISDFGFGFRISCFRFRFEASVLGFWSQGQGLRVKEVRVMTEWRTGGGGYRVCGIFDGTSGGRYFFSSSCNEFYYSNALISLVRGMSVLKCVASE